MAVHGLPVFRPIAGIVLQVMGRLGHKVIAIRRMAALMLERKDGTRRHGRRIGDADMALMARGIAFGFLAGLPLTQGSRLVTTRDLIAFDIVVTILARGHGRFYLQIGRGLCHVIVKQRHLARDNPTDIGPFKDRIAVATAVTYLIADSERHLSIVGMGADTIRQHDLFRRRGMVEEIIDPFFFHQTADKIEIAFAKLHTVVALLAGVAGLVGHIRKAGFREYLLDDLDRGHALKHPVVRPDGQKPRPWPQFHCEQVNGILMPKILDRNAKTAELETIIGFQRDRGAKD